MRREDILNFLRINQIKETDSDEEIRRALTAGHWHERDVETAILILRGKAKESSGISVANAVVHSDIRPSSETVASLLGLDVSLKNIQISNRVEAPTFFSRALHSVVILFVSALLAVGAGMMLMYFFDIGPYHGIT